MHYDLRLPPATSATPEPDAFPIHRREVPPSEGRDDLFNPLVIAFFGDLRVRRRR